MPYTSALENTAAAASAKIRPYILRTAHDRYPWLFISPGSKEDVRAVVECLLKEASNLKAISNETGIEFGDDPWHTVEDFYPIVWTTRAGMLDPPFPGNNLVIVGLDYVDQNNGLPEMKKASLSPGEFIVIPHDTPMKLTEGSGGTSLFVLFKL